MQTRGMLLAKAWFVLLLATAATGVQADKFIGKGNPLPQEVHAFRPTSPPAPVPYGHQEGHHWHYYAGGDDWEGLCATGLKQSPVNIASEAAGGADDSIDTHSNASKSGSGGPAHVPGGDICSVYAGSPQAAPFALDFHYEKVSNMTMEHNGHALQVTGDLGFVVARGQRYRVKQFHFHSPSEHTFNSNRQHDGHASMEMHIVHQREGAKGLEDLLVIAVLFDVNPDTHDASVAETAPNKFLDSIEWNAAPSEEGRVHVIRGDVDLNILQDCVFSHDYYCLEGSLTTPPCAETVAWFVMGARQRMQQRQLEFITRLFANNYHFAFGLGNNRATQPLDGRVITWFHHATEPATECRQHANHHGHPCQQCSQEQTKSVPK